jgi:hypothetical protein
MTVSDGATTIPVGGGTFWSSSFIQTDSSENISLWAIVELVGAGRSFIPVGDQCCAAGDVPFMDTFKTTPQDYILEPPLPPTPTPLPPALPLFATGLGALGLLGWRRKRKNAAAIATA